MAKKLEQKPVSVVVRTTKYSLSKEDMVDVMIQHLRRQGFHAPDKDKANYTISYPNYLYSNDGTIDVQWKEPV